MSKSFSSIHYGCDTKVAGHTKISLNKYGYYEFENLIDSGEANLTLRGTFTRKEARELRDLFSIELDKECEA